MFWKLTAARLCVAVTTAISVPAAPAVGVVLRSVGAYLCQGPSCAGALLVPGQLLAREDSIILRGELLAANEQPLVEVSVCENGFGAVSLATRTDVRLRVDDAVDFPRRPNQEVCTLPSVPYPRLDSHESSSRLGLPSFAPDPASEESQIARSLTVSAGESMRRVGESILRQPLDYVSHWQRISWYQTAGLFDEALGALRYLKELSNHPEMTVAVSDQLERQHNGKANSRDLATPNAPNSACGVPVGDRKVKALIVGIGNFAEGQRLRQLEFPTDDAKLFAGLLRAGAAGRVEHANDIQILYDETATIKAINSWLDQIRDSPADRNASIWVYFATHGSVGLPEGGRGSGELVIHAYGSNSDAGVPSFTFDSVYQKLQLIARRSCQTHIVLDLCNAGLLSPAPNLDPKFLEKSLHRGRRFPAYMYLATDGMDNAYEVPQLALRLTGGESTRGHGIFTYFLTRALAGVDPDNTQIRFKDLKRTLEDTIDEKSGQRPQLRTFAGSDDIVTGKPTPSPAEFPAKPPDIKGTRSRGAPAVGSELDGWRIVNAYVNGEEDHLTKADFEDCGRYFERQWRGNPQSRSMEQLYRFCDGRALTFSGGNFKRGLEQLSAALRLQPNGAYLWNAIGVAWFEQNRYTRAAEYFREAIRLRPAWSYPKHNLALILFAQGDYQGALAEYAKALAKTPGRSYLVYNRALLMANLGMTREAASEFRKLRSHPRAPVRADALTALAALELKAGKQEKARNLLNAALSEDPSNAPAIHNLAVLKRQDKSSAGEAESDLRPNVTAKYIPSMRQLADWIRDYDRDSAEDLYCEAWRLERFDLAKQALLKRLRRFSQRECPK